MTDASNENNYWEKAGEVRAVHPHGNSLKCLSHFIQNHNREGTEDYFCKFDYGEQENMVRYGQRQPPTYNLSLIDTKTIIYYGTHDKYLTQSAIDKLVSKLPNAKVETQKLDKWGHVTFAYGRNMKPFYTKIFNSMFK
jgi:gastric triacylglycerol lipase